MLKRNKDQKAKKNSRIRSNTMKRDLTSREQKGVRAGGGVSGGVLGDRQRGDKATVLN